MRDSDAGYRSKAVTGNTVKRGLHRMWNSHPNLRPVQRPKTPTYDVDIDKLLDDYMVCPRLYHLSTLWTETFPE